MDNYSVVSKVSNNTYTAAELNQLREMFITGQRAALALHTTNATGEGVYNITDISQLPWAPVGNVITVPNGAVIGPACNIDMGGLRLVAAGTMVISGSNAETAEITSTGLPAGEALVTSTGTLNLRNVTLNPPIDCYGVNIDGVSTPGAAADWYGVNFKTGIPFIISNLSNFVCQVAATLGCQDGLKFTGDFDTIRVESSLIAADGAGKTAVDFDSAIIINRRIVFSGCPIIATNGAVGMSLPLTATIQNDRYVLLFCDFAGGGTPLVGFSGENIKSRHFQCTGIENTCRIGGFEMEDNATATPIAVPGTFYKILGTTTPTLLENGFTSVNNRSTCNSAISKTYHIDFSVTFAGTSGKVYGFKVYKDGVEATGVVKSTANSSGKAENISGSGAVRMVSGEYVEVWVTNLSGSNPITVIDMHMGLTEAA